MTWSPCGRVDPQNRRHAHIAPRTVTLDAWEAGAIADWTEEQNERRPGRPDESMIHTGRHALTSDSAAISASQQVLKAITKAGLATTAGLTPASLRLWGAVRDARDP